MTRLTRSLLSLTATAAILAPGCNDGWKWSKDGNAGKSSSGSGSWFGTKPGGEEWTIECGIYSHDDHRRTAEDLAEGLRALKELKPNLVTVNSNDLRSIIYYGTYRLNRDQRNDMIVFSDEINKDLRYIRSLAPVNGQFPFLAARPVPKQTESKDPKTGPPEWNLANAKGVYTLQVGVTYNTAGFNERIEAAVEWVRDLRGRGYEAYYYHDTGRSLVTVGLFDESAVAPSQDGRPQYSDAVRALRAKEEFSLNLENGMKTFSIQDDGTRAANPSFLVRLPKSSAAP